ncbi:MAG: hypothetical protein EOP34_06650 [Rickettsiales bacterium]|nr:MAG: hypothetical protein EOP34_06650 [Rickettsiales bacterium]
MFLRTAKLYNNLKIRLDSQTVKSEEDLKLLSEYLNLSNEFKLKRNNLESKLIEHGINPSEQFNNEYGSDSESNSSSYSSDKTQSSNHSEARSNKRVKYSNVGQNSDFSLGFIGFNLIPMLRILSCLFSAIILLVIHLNILPNLDLCFIKVDLSQLLFLYLIVNLAKLIYK